jgi:four helix bundle protein
VVSGEWIGVGGFFEILQTPAAQCWVAPNSVQDLEVWRVAMCIVKEIYQTTRAWPREELYGLTNQVRRAAVSVPANLAEGAGRNNAGDFSRFAQIALGSIYELDTLLQIANELGYPSAPVIVDLRSRLSSLARRTTNLIHYQQSKRRPTDH